MATKLDSDRGGSKFYELLLRKSQKHEEIICTNLFCFIERKIESIDPLLFHSL